MPQRIYKAFKALSFAPRARIMSVTRDSIKRKELLVIEIDSSFTTQESKGLSRNLSLGQTLLEQMDYLAYNEILIESIYSYHWARPRRQMSEWFYNPYQDYP